MNILQWIGLLFAAALGTIVALFKKYYMPSTDSLNTPIHPSQPPTAPATAPIQPVQPSALLWDTKPNIRHSVRLIADSEGLNREQKDTMCATIEGESGFNLKAVNYNKNSKGVVTSTDRGICQWNDRFHGSEITPDEAFNNPEKAVRLMCSYWKRGQRNLWCAYSNGRYKLFL